ncbi:hypothetical protein VULLAG_LOCUS18321 [Vulpes lagopus]
MKLESPARIMKIGPRLLWREIDQSAEQAQKAAEGSNATPGRQPAGSPSPASFPRLTSAQLNSWEQRCCCSGLAEAGMACRCHTDGQMSISHSLHLGHHQFQKATAPGLHPLKAGQKGPALLPVGREKGAIKMNWLSWMGGGRGAGGGGRLESPPFTCLSEPRNSQILDNPKPINKQKPGDGVPGWAGTKEPGDSGCFWGGNPQAWRLLFCATSFVQGPGRIQLAPSNSMMRGGLP